MSVDLYLCVDTHIIKRERLGIGEAQKNRDEKKASCSSSL